MRFDSGTRRAGTGKGFSTLLGGTCGFLLECFGQEPCRRSGVYEWHFRCPGVQQDGLLPFSDMTLVCLVPESWTPFLSMAYI